MVKVYTVVDQGGFRLWMGGVNLLWIWWSGCRYDVRGLSYWQNLAMAERLYLPYILHGTLDEVRRGHHTSACVGGWREISWREYRQRSDYSPRQCFVTHTSGKCRPWTCVNISSSFAELSRQRSPGSDFSSGAMRCSSCLVDSSVADKLHRDNYLN